MKKIGSSAGKSKIKVTPFIVFAMNGVFASLFKSDIVLFLVGDMP